MTVTGEQVQATPEQEAFVTKILGLMELEASDVTGFERSFFGGTVFFFRSEYRSVSSTESTTRGNLLIAKEKEGIVYIETGGSITTGAMHREVQVEVSFGEEDQVEPFGVVTFTYRDGEVVNILTLQLHGRTVTSALLRKSGNELEVPVEIELSQASKLLAEKYGIGLFDDEGVLVDGNSLVGISHGMIQQGLPTVDGETVPLIPLASQE